LNVSSSSSDSDSSCSSSSSFTCDTCSTSEFSSNEEEPKAPVQKPPKTASRIRHDLERKRKGLAPLKIAPWTGRESLTSPHIEPIKMMDIVREIPSPPIPMHQSSFAEMAMEIHQNQDKHMYFMCFSCSFMHF
jgi:hypothetical protein